MMFRTMTGG